MNNDTREYKDKFGTHGNGKFRLLDIEMVSIIVVMLIALVCMIVMMVNMNNKLDDLAEASGLYTEANIKDLEASTGAVNLTGDELDKAINMLVDGSYNLMHSNSYITCAESDEANTTLIYNKNGETIAQDSTGSVTIYKTDNNAVYFGESITYGKDCDAVKNLWIAAQAAKDGYGVVSEIDMSDVGENVRELLVDIHGYDNIAKMYNYIDSKYAADMIVSLKESVTSGDFSKETDTSYLNMRLAYVFDGDTLVSGGCYIYFGENSSGYWDNCYTTWYFDGYYEVGDWELGDKWYSYDYNTTSDDNGETITEMLNTTYNSVLEMLEQYSDDAPIGGTDASNNLSDNNLADGIGGIGDITRDDESEVSKPDNTDN